MNLNVRQRRHDAEHARADHANIAARFAWRNWLARLEDVCISRVASGVVGMLGCLSSCRRNPSAVGSPQVNGKTLSVCFNPSSEKGQLE